MRHPREPARPVSEPLRALARLAAALGAAAAVSAIVAYVFGDAPAGGERPVQPAHATAALLALGTGAAVPLTYLLALALGAGRAPVPLGRGVDDAWLLALIAALVPAGLWLPLAERVAGGSGLSVPGPLGAVRTLVVAALLLLRIVQVNGRRARRDASGIGASE